MLWYVLQTYTGREEKLAEMIRKLLPEDCYGDCFVTYYEQLRDRKQENQIHILRLFPGYIFISTDDIELLFQRLKTVPAMSKIIASGAYEFLPLYEGEAEFLLNVMDEEHIVRLTYVATDGRDRILGMSGPLERCRENIRAYKFRKRETEVSFKIAGQEKIVHLGIILNDDIRREMAYGKVENLRATPNKYISAAELKQRNGEDAPQFKAGDSVIVTDGVFEGSAAVIRRVDKNTVKIAVTMFGREIFVEVPAEGVVKIC